MKKLVSLITGLLLVTLAVVTVYAAKPTSVDSSGNETSWEHTSCTKIQDGVLMYQPGRYLAGELLEVGFDTYGYNYQSHLFKGYYANVYLNRYGFPPYEGDDTAYFQKLVDEGYVSDVADAMSLMDTQWYWLYRMYDLQMKWNDAWIANTDCNNDGLLDRHYGYPSYLDSGAWQTNQYGGDGWASLTKFVAVPSDATLSSGYWFTTDGVEIGQTIWGQFAITQDVLSGEGVLYVSPAGPGYGQY